MERKVLTEEEQAQYMEAANKLFVLYAFEKNIAFTDSFLETIKIIHEQDTAWNEYIRFLDMPINKLFPEDPGWNDHLNRLISGLIGLHVIRLKIPWTPEELNMAGALTYTVFEAVLQMRFSNEDLNPENFGDWTRDRSEWLPIELSLHEVGEQTQDTG